MLISARVDGISTYLPTSVLTNQQLAAEFDGWTAEKILAKTGIANRHIASDCETAGDLACKAAEKLFAENSAVKNEDIDFLILCTQTPDYFLPTTACVLQDRLGLSTSCGALDFNLGCSGYIYGLSLASSLIASQQARKVLLLTSDTYSKFIAADDQSVKTLFGDGAAATVISATESGSSIGPFLFGTDGSGAEKLIVRQGAMRNPHGSGPTIEMSGPDVFAFTMKVVPKAIHDFLDQSNQTIDQMDHVVFHQANQFMLEHLRSKIGIPRDKFVVAMQNFGNTVSSSIPIAMHQKIIDGEIKRGDKILLVGFGVGLSWGVTSLVW